MKCIRALMVKPPTHLHPSSPTLESALWAPVGPMLALCAKGGGSWRRLRAVPFQLMTSGKQGGYDSERVGGQGVRAERGRSR